MNESREELLARRRSEHKEALNDYRSNTWPFHEGPDDEIGKADRLMDLMDGYDRLLEYFDKREPKVAKAIREGFNESRYCVECEEYKNNAEFLDDSAICGKCRKDETH